MRNQNTDTVTRVPMFVVLGAIALFALIVFNRVFHFHYVKATESAFSYDVNNGQPVNPANNPLRQFGPRVAFGWNARWFSVDSQLADYKFMESKADNNDDTLEWNSLEGVGMRVSYRMFGQVQDPWRFYMHYGHLDFNYDTEGHIDQKIFQALRQAGKVVDQYMNIYAATNRAETIRANPDAIRAYALLHTQEYMQRLGFQVTDVQFLSNFSFINGDTVQKARQQITDVNTEISNKQQALLNESNQYKIDGDQAKIDADNRIAAAAREASFIIAETKALATAMSQSIEQIGIDGTMQIFITERYGEIMRHGIVPLVVVKEDSMFAAPFYPAKGGTPTTNASGNLAMKLHPQK